MFYKLYGLLPSMGTEVSTQPNLKISFGNFRVQAWNYGRAIDSYIA